MTLDVNYRHKLKSMLTQEESYRQFPYTDTKGNLTIGIGRNLQSRGISLDEALFLLDDDIMAVEHDLWKCCPAYPVLSDPRKVVLVDMCFNMGIEKLMQFRKMMAALLANDFEGAAREMLASQWHKDVGVRAEKLAAIMETNIL